MPVGKETWGEKAENGLLRSRLDEQSQLICLLKRRADDTGQRCQGLERMNEELEKKVAEAENLLAAERKRADQLEERFGLLASNHQEMIRFKDVYKRENEELRAECEGLRAERHSERLETERMIEGLREERHPELLETERIIEELRTQLQATSIQISQQGERHREEADLEQGALLEENQDKRQQLHLLTGRLKESEEICQQLKEELSNLMEIRKTEQVEAEGKAEELNKEKKELLQLCMERGRTLQEHQKDLSELSNRLQGTEKAWREAKERYQREVTAVNADSRVQELNTRLDDSEKQLELLRREFEAYKKHSGDLLANERELNAKLRHLIG
ncbi:PREDICTED: coiled-coil domain-containing protein 89 [Nanorana parkeri]|uniref:coiled-coil domain-containing protein 89 n=1 Tax=Nanorana parkeri TaxID=125878 RepID=UPI000854F092|nr:PREDICTED: coiled-coil domain-containing protein 89 [Nanorana parkeri]